MLTAADRERIRVERDRATREVLAQTDPRTHRQPATRCEFCSRLLGPGPASRRFCSDTHRKRWNRLYGQAAA